jgi:hypothetical protein
MVDWVDGATGADVLWRRALDLSGPSIQAFSGASMLGSASSDRMTLVATAARADAGARVVLASVPR